MNREDIFTFLSNNKKTLNKYGVKNIALFGSYVKGTANEESDIDFLVEFENNKKNFDNYMDLKFFLEDNLNTKVDLVINENVKEELKEEIYGSAKYAQN
ncbi:MAG: nucleotidyltransferase family protein [Halanaerobiales bacterium]|nr:nucleotidyltransferase family protein [Halanaerobiales bacterium]